METGLTVLWKVKGFSFSIMAMYIVGKLCDPCVCIHPIPSTSLTYFLRSNFLNNTMDGLGVYTYKDGAIYTGQYSKGQKCGQGKYSFKDKAQSYSGGKISFGIELYKTICIQYVSNIYLFFSRMGEQ